MQVLVIRVDGAMRRFSVPFTFVYFVVFVKNLIFSQTYNLAQSQIVSPSLCLLTARSKTQRCGRRCKHYKHYIKLFVIQPQKSNSFQILLFPPHMFLLNLTCYVCCAYGSSMKNSTMPIIQYIHVKASTLLIIFTNQAQRLLRK